MESSPTPEEAAAALAQASGSAARLAGAVHLPAYLHSSIGAAITLQITTSAIGISRQDGHGMAVVVAGLAVFVAIAVVQLVRFRTLNGAWVWSLVSQVVLGSGTAASLVYGLTFAAAVVAAFADLWWLVAVAAIVGGIGYARCGQQWLHRYRQDPTARGRGQDGPVVLLSGLVALVGLVLLVAGR